MNRHSVSLRELRFVVEDWLQAPSDWPRMKAFATLDADTAAHVLDEAARFTSEVLAPLNGPADLQGCRFDNGRVITPDGFRDAYRAYVRAGWPALACSEHDGGQGLPGLLDAMLNEMIAGANHAWAMYPGLLHGAYRCMSAHAPEWIRERYLPRVVSGEWLASMCLTEPQAGSDLGLVRTRAEPADNGSYHLQGSKIFISGGAHDLTDNILHLVLARLPDAPGGTRGLSLFLVPQRIDDGEHLHENAVRCDGIEKKMGIKGSATCSLTFERAQGWLIGEPHRGLAAMFIMMNSARLHVGLQGLGHAETALQLASAYAAERRQMRAVRIPPGPSEADPIQMHPAVTQILLELRAWTEGMRMVGAWSAHLIDCGEHDPDPGKREQALTLAALLTPMIKAFFSERGFLLSSRALQVFGGYGYVHEYGIEQVVRDSRIAMIYEGTNEIQALDLLLRKVIGDRGRGLNLLLDHIRQEIVACAALQQPDCREFAQRLEALCERLADTSRELTEAAAADPELPHRAAGDYLQLVGVILIAYGWLRAARISAARAADDPFHARKLTTARYYYRHGVLEAEAALQRIAALREPLPLFE